MEVRLKQMKLRNFKGIKELEVDFNGQNTDIYGKNATGKTTLVDAFTWLFFNKDSTGSADFDVKTKNENGEYLHNLEHSVEVIVEVIDKMVEGGSPVSVEKSFKKIFKEKYTKQRGSTTATFTGHTTDYFVDDVPRKKKEYDEIVNQLFDSNIFPMITDPFYFNTRMKWQDRRKMLIDICGDVSDELVINFNNELVPLLSVLNGKNVDDYRTQLKRQMKPINEELKAIPIKINEAHLAIPNEIEEFDEEKYKFINEKINEFEAKKQTALSGGAIADKETELINLKNKKLLIENEIPINTKQFKDKIYELSLQEDEMQRKIERLKADVQAKKSMQKSNEFRRDELREKYKNVNSMQYDESQNICQYCGQNLPTEKVDELIKKFNISKSGELERIGSEGKRLKEEFDKRADEIILLENNIETMQRGIADLQNVIKEKDDELNKIHDNFKADQKQKVNKIDIQISDIEREIQHLKSESGDAVNQYEEKLNNLKNKKAILDSIVASKNLAEAQKKRIEQLEAREKQLVDEYHEKDKLLYLTDLFIKTKVEMLTEKINSHFKLCNFKLFNIQINGGLEECCIPTYNGVEYTDLNTASKINVGLDCINTISDFANCRFPVFLDNAECINKPLETVSQQIRLYVTEDEKLRVEKGN